MPGSVHITNVNGLTVVVDINTVGASPAEPDTYSDADLATPVSLPVTITADTTLYVDGTGGFTLSVKVDGTEVGPGEVFLTDQAPVTFSLDADPANTDVDRLVGLAGIGILTAPSVTVGGASSDIGFYGTTPIPQPAAISLVATTAATNVGPYGYSQAQANALVAAVNFLIKAVSAAQGGNGLTR